MKEKSQLGQFYTKNNDKILKGMNIPKGVKIMEPFAGEGDLINDLKGYEIVSYDLHPKQDYIEKRDTLMDPPDYSGYFVLTNPPYLAKNKNKDKSIYEKYKVDDLYKCFIKCLVEIKCLGGMIIIPLNFLSSTRKCDIDLRRSFMNAYYMEMINIFEEQVFEDTKYTVCSILFSQKKEEKTRICVYPSGKIFNVVFDESNKYMIGGEVLNLKKPTRNISRLTKENINSEGVTNIKIQCIDSNSGNMIKAVYVSDEERYVDNTIKLSSRTYMTLIIHPVIDISEQKLLITKFNDYLNTNREKYNSLFLSNYRESSDIARKRISFDLVYRIIEDCLK